MALQMLVTYVFAIGLRNLVPPESNIEETYFSSVLEAMHNLIIFGTFLDNLADFALAVKDDSSICLVMIWTYIALASLTVMNMLIGVLCEVISAVAAEENESASIDKIHEKFGQIVEELDQNKDGTLSWMEFQALIENPEATKALESVNVDAEGMIDLAEDFFFEDGKPVNVDFPEFMGMVLDCRGGQNATVKDIMAVGKRFSAKTMSLMNRMDDYDKKMNDFDKKIDLVLKQTSGNRSGYR
eukprot:gnl/TRDRNA2_/TRDRNA2_177356_c1_seq1.p1 gnl/TRDRNA2_/TRDRNA2_177356_c1~~gnl/TRDRNA2_/TRDRNA2_177356_c1_seq1.p1  ORF type:complete len:266 (-),score=59.46 gnl/TRDRNA2_/TRDRNA2_177356_c1_seq1:53-778(-)